MSSHDLLSSPKEDPSLHKGRSRSCYPRYSFFPLTHHFASVEGIPSSRQRPALSFADVSDARALRLSAVLPSFF